MLRRELMIPMSHIANGVRILGLIDYDATVAEAALASAGVGLEDLEDPDRYLDGDAFKCLLETLLKEHEGEDPLSLSFIKHTAPAALGLVGFAAVSSSSVVQAVDTMVKYHSLTMPAVKITAHDSVRELTLRFELVADFESCGEFLLECVMGAVLMIDQPGYLDQKLLINRWDFAYGNADRFREYEKHLKISINSSQPFNQISIDKSCLNYPLKSANLNTFHSMQRQLVLLAETSGRNLAFTNKVRDVLRDHAANGRYLSLDELADALFKSKRTLTRRLADEGSAYQEILDDIRKQHAMELLGNSDKNIDHICAELGYGSRASFFRAFKAWTGVTPRQFRLNAGSSVVGH